ncbi:MAG: hypothetical protein VZQ51_03985 [Bacteroidales bacterium]|nr:hypothetical protein [Bacteroidales bacterium]
MKLLIHPLIIPFYAFCLMYELERQTYAPDLTAAVYMSLFIFTVFVIFPYVSKFQFSAKKADALWDTDADIRTRIQYACILTGGYLAASYMLESIEFFNTMGAENIFTVFILPLWLNVFSAKDNYAASLFSGSLSGLIPVIGYKAGTDTFWPFVISLLIFSLSTMYRIDKEKAKFSHSIYGFFIGATQAAAIFLLLK